jgi:CDP-glucose 4,6-dehydratase
MENMVTAKELASFYNNKKVFITGHTGFKGSWLMATLQSFGAEIKGYALEPENSNGLFNYLQPLSPGKSIISDIRDKQKLKKEVREFKPDFIFHLAAQPLVRRSYEIPAETFEVNVTGTANLLEAAIDLDNKCSIIAITTDKVYHNKEKDILYNEDDPLGGYDPYSASKACAELVVDSFRRSFFNPGHYELHKKAIASVRAGNVIGGGDWSRDRIIPDIINSLQHGEIISVRNPFAVRPWQHVLEAIAGYLLLGMKIHKEPAAFSKAYNFGPLPGDHLPVKQLVEKAIESWGNGNWKDVSDPGQPHEAGLLKLDITRALNELSWKPKLNAGKAIEWTVNWYKKPAEEKAPYSFQQIEEYYLL